MKFFSAALLICACASSAPSVSPERLAALKEVNEDQVAKCLRLGRFEGISAIAGEPGMAQAREEARARAAAAGATDVVVAREYQTPDVASSVVIGWDCAASH